MKLWNQEILSIEMTGDKIRAAVVRGAGRRFDVVDFITMTLTQPGEDLPSVEAIKAIGERLRFAGGSAVFVTPMARSFELTMDRAKVAGLSAYQLKNAVKWEVEPYTGITGSNALIGVEPVRKTAAAPGEVEVEDDDAPATVNVSAMERNVHRALKARFKAVGFRLQRVYPPEITFYMPLFLEPSREERAILDVGENFSGFAVLGGRRPRHVRTLNISVEAITAHVSGETVSADLEATLQSVGRDAPAGKPLVVSGPGAAIPAVVDYIAGFCPAGAVPLTLARSAGLADARDYPAYAVYAGAVGAAVRELRGRGERALGLDDREDLYHRLRKSAYLAPLAASLVMALLLFAHYGYMTHKEKVYKAQLMEINAELAERKARIAEYDRMMQEEREIQAKIDFAQKRLDFITGQAVRELAGMIDCLDGIAAALPETIVLSDIAQNADGRYAISGTARDLRSVSRFVTELQNAPWCESAVLDMLDNSGAPGARLRFRLTVARGREVS
jgi:Tfp pilus assembly protein PilN